MYVVRRGSWGLLLSFFPLLDIMLPWSFNTCHQRSNRQRTKTENTFIHIVNCIVVLSFEKNSFSVLHPPEPTPHSPTTLPLTSPYTAVYIPDTPCRRTPSPDDTFLTLASKAQRPPSPSFKAKIDATSFTEVLLSLPFLPQPLSSHPLLCTLQLSAVSSPAAAPLLPSLNPTYSSGAPMALVPPEFM